MILRDYQNRDIDHIRAAFGRGLRRICYQGPCGSGKTILFVHAAQKAIALNQRVMILVHRVELVDQTCEALTAEGIAFGVIAAGYPENPTAPVQVAMVMTLINRLHHLKNVAFLIIDEAHHIMAATWQQIMSAAPRARVLGVTATPERLDGKGLHEAFDELIIGPTVKELIAQNWLAPFVVYAPERQVNLKRIRTTAGDYALGALAEKMNTDIVLEDALTEYRKHLLGRTALTFCVTIAHSQAVARYFRMHGVRAVHLDGDTPAKERHEIIAGLATGKIEMISSCSVIAEGLNVPEVAGVILLRPTKSLTIYLQQIGRALRPASGKQRAVILDHSGNVYRHGFPDLEHPWSLNGRPKKRGQAPVKRCPECGTLVPSAVMQCPECNHVFSPPEPKISTPQPLVQIDPANAHEYWLATGPFQAVVRWAGDDVERLQAVAQARGFRPGWVYMRLKAQREAAENALLRTIQF
jgi:DNA repair protein RadD